MDNDINKKIQRSLNIRKLLPIIIIIILILSILFILFRQFFLNNTSDDNTSNVNTNEVIYLEISDPSTISLENRDIILPTGWNITAYINEASYNSLQCNTLISSNSESKCLIYEIFDGTNFFYISNPVSLINIDNPKGLVKLEEVTFLGKTSNLNIEELDLYVQNESGELVLDETSKFIKQAYVCSDNICLSSGKLSLDVLKSNEVLTNFKALISKM